MPRRGKNNFNTWLMFFCLAVSFFIPVFTSAQEINTFRDIKDKILLKISPQISWTEKNIIEPLDDFRIKQTSLAKEWNEKQKSNLEEVRKKTESEKQEIESDEERSIEKKFSEIVNFAKDFPFVQVLGVFAGEAFLFFVSHKIIFFTICALITITILKIFLKKIVQVFNALIRKNK